MCHLTTSPWAATFPQFSHPIMLRAGPILLEDYQLTEKLANFDRERIPERVVHARGAAAKGFFEVRGLEGQRVAAGWLQGGCRVAAGRGFTWELVMLWVSW